MSFFIAYFPFDFECAKVQQFPKLAMLLRTFFIEKTQIAIFQSFISFFYTDFMKVKTFLHLNKINKREKVGHMVLFIIFAAK